ncbi:MAG: D-tyrosyl-tRNA(Tyr) deacylase [Clostridiales bacterium]|nr:D-tyrosyl-tRNA(Tyr) deacylase [Clostridiales bacterium]
MKIVIQRVNRARLISGEFTSEIGFGLLASVGVNVNDTIKDIEYLAKKIVNLRIFKDEDGKCNKSLLDVDGEIMIVSNFTLQARIGSGTRPDFSKAGGSEFALQMYNKLLDEVIKQGVKKVAKGNFGNYMEIDTSLNGPFNLILESEGR